MSENKTPPDNANGEETAEREATIQKLLPELNGKTVLEAALAYAKSGIPVFPCNPTTRAPLTSNGFYGATTDENQIRAWWKKHPNTLVGVPTGSRSGFITLDVDRKNGKDGFQSLAELMSKHGVQLPQTRTRSTPHGTHFDFKNADGIRNSESKLGPGLDVRGEGGYIIVAGKTSEGEYVETDHSEVADLPEWFSEEIKEIENRKKQKRHNSAAQPTDRTLGMPPYVKAAIDAELARLTSAQEGTRNSTLNAVAFSLGQWVPEFLSESEARDMLLQAALACGLGENEARKTIESGLVAGMREPRQVPEQEKSNNAADSADTSDDSTEAVTNSRFLPTPPPVPLEVFPDDVQDMLKEADTAFGVPIEIPVACFIGSLSALLGQSRLIAIKDSWGEAANLWLVIVAPSGVGKSPAQKEFFRPLHRLEYSTKLEHDKASEKYLEDLADYNEAKKAASKKRAKGNTLGSIFKVPDKPERPTLKLATLNDFTAEALADALNENPKGVMVSVDELAAFLFGLDRYTNAKGGFKAQLLATWSRGHWRTSRSSNRARNIFVPSACLSILGGIQPGMLSRVFEGGVGGVDEESGFLPRFLFIRAVAEAPSYWSKQAFSQTSKDLLERITDAMWQWGVSADGEGIPVPVSEEARARYVAWYDEIAREAFIARNAAPLRKLQAHALRLCLLLHCLDSALGGSDGLHPVTEDTMRRALLLADWLKEHQRQCWQLFNQEKAKKQADPIERAVMAVAVAEAASIEASGWQVGNADFYPLVRKRMDMPKLTEETIGKACSRLGLKDIKIGPKRLRGWRLTPELIKSFRATVSPVSTDSTHCGTNGFERDSSGSEPPQPSHPSLPGRDSRDSGEIELTHEKQDKYQSIESDETVEAVAAEGNSEFKAPTRPAQNTLPDRARP
ncbi:MAG: DUF3987 domain-containing protein [Cystobacterineae bacterium]|nr:DUF3987 domain-containing protein [Cystobacterineae bacterium]